MRRIRHIFFNALFNFFTSNIYKTARFTRFDKTSDVVVLSMLQQKDMAMYLIAIKSLLRFLSVQKVIIICDKSLTNSDILTLKEHIEEIEFYPAANFEHDSLPVGGTWERLAAIAHFSKDYYVIQMDADTLTLTNPVEVIQAVHNNVPFILGTDKFWNRKFSLLEMSEIAKKWIDKGADHIQVLCENELVTLFETTQYHCYIRGCSGFTGFSKKSISIDDLIYVSNIFHAQIGSKWSKWGTEQFTSNLILSNLKDVTILPNLKYTTPDYFDGKNAFIHFIGPLRFNNFLYQRLAVSFLKSICL
jgi:hypothetical protein